MFKLDPLFRRPKHALFCGVIFSSLCLNAPAFAQSGSSDPDFEGNAGAVIINGLQVIKRQDLDFGVIAPSLTEEGTVHTYRRSNNSSICSASLTCFEPGNRSRFTVIGDANRVVMVSNPGSIWINDGNGNRMLVDNFTGAGSANETEFRGWVILRNSGISRFNVGAILHVNANQAVGDYIGQFTLNFEYQ